MKQFRMAGFAMWCVAAAMLAGCAGSSAPPDPMPSAVPSASPELVPDEDVVAPDADLSMLAGSELPSGLTVSLTSTFSGDTAWEIEPLEGRQGYRHLATDCTVEFGTYDYVSGLDDDLEATLRAMSESLHTEDLDSGPSIRSAYPYDPTGWGALLLALAGCTSVGSSTENAPADCVDGGRVNELWQDYYAAAASNPFGDGPTFPNPDHWPFLLGEATDIEPETLAGPLGRSCVYVGQPDADDLGMDGAWFIVSDYDVDEDAIDEVLDGLGWTKTDSVGDRAWEMSSCGGQMLEFTQMVLGKPELVGGYVETFSEGLHALFPDAKYALMVAGMRGC